MGAWNVTCQVCGFRYKSDEIRHRWDGVIVCHPCWEPRHPQELVRKHKETSSDLPFVSPEIDGPSVAPPYVFTPDPPPPGTFNQG